LALDPNEFGKAELPDADLIPESGFYHPAWEQVESDLTAVRQRLNGDDLPIVAIAINLATISSCDTAWIDRLIESLRERGLASYAFYGPRKRHDRFTRMTCLREGDQLVAIPELIINAALVFRPQDRKKELESIGVPVLQTLPSRRRSVEQWQSSQDGLALDDISYYYASSELAGMIDPVLVSARHQVTQSLEPIGSQMDAVADRAAALCRLRKSAPAERRVAMLVYNYPPGENNFGASFLNVPKSLENVIRALRAAGYDAQDADAETLTRDLQRCLQGLYKPDVLTAMYASGDASLLSLDRYETWFQTLPQATRNRITHYWGSPESMADYAGDDGSTSGFIVPRVDLGAILVMPQPLRHEITTASGDASRKQRISHRSAVPLSHRYLATYLFIREQFDAHAVIHFGTHGTQEWAPGKQRALSADDEAMLAIGGLPNFYPYIMDNLGEATTAKRRGRATMIGHLTPMFTPSGFRPGLHDMHIVMHDWETVASGP
ncbi:MAG: cobaltochelatase subunit CobN, partial [Planctomycetota bacterium]